MPGDRQAPWGWHQLDDRWAERLVALAGIRPGDLVLDVGAGTGALTRPLAHAGARVIAIERHPARLAALDRDFGDDRRVRVVRADAAQLRLPRRPFHVVANPPFAVSTALLKRLLAPGSRLLTAHLVLQRGTAERWAGGRAPGAGRWARDHDLQVALRVPRRAFTPRSPFDVAVLVVRRR